jgi:putative transposase
VDSRGPRIHSRQGVKLKLHTPPRVMEFKIYKHVPPHLFIDEAIYFVTCTTYGKAKLLETREKKMLVLNTLEEVMSSHDIDLVAWVILDNHYHTLFQVKNAKTIPLVFQRVHGKSSFEINRIDGIRRRKVWYNYWDECVRDERDYYNKLNYIHLNPVKHGYVENAEDYEFSSYPVYLEANGEEWINDVLLRYPVAGLLKTDR